MCEREPEFGLGVFLFNLPFEYLSALGVLLLSYGLLRLLLVRFIVLQGYEKNEFRKLVVDRFFNLFFFFVLGWKLSPLMFQTATVISAPTALLYLPGGWPGLGLGVAAAGIYLTYLLVDPKKKIIPVDLRGFRQALLFGALSLTILGLGVIGYHEFTRTPVAEAPKAPDFSLQDGSGNWVSLSSFRGQPVVLNFWASWCPPCRAEFPELVAFQNKWAGKAVLLGINALSTEKNPGEIQSFLESQRVNFPIIYDNTGDVQKLYGVTVLPTTVVIDSLGRIIEFRSGALTEASLTGTLTTIP